MANLNLSDHDLEQVECFGLNYCFSFGKYRGEKLLSVIKSNPLYVYWCARNIEWFFITDKAAEVMSEHISELLKSKGHVFRTMDLESKIRLNLYNKIFDDFDTFVEKFNDALDKRDMDNSGWSRDDWSDDEITGGEMDFDTWFAIK